MKMTSNSLILVTRTGHHDRIMHFIMLYIVLLSIIIQMPSTKARLQLQTSSALGLYVKNTNATDNDGSALFGCDCSSSADLASELCQDWCNPLSNNKSLLPEAAAAASPSLANESSLHFRVRRSLSASASNLQRRSVNERTPPTALTSLADENDEFFIPPSFELISDADGKRLDIEMIVRDDGDSDENCTAGWYCGEEEYNDTACVGEPIYCNLTYEEYSEMLYDYISPTFFEWVLIFSHFIVFLVGLVGNALVCIAVYTNYTMRTVTNIFIVNLAVADFFVILFCLPPTVVWDVTETWFMGRTMCKIVVYFQSVSVSVSVLTLTFISLDRWYAICFPLRYVSTNSRAVLSIGFIWLVALVADIPEFLVLTTIEREGLRFNMTLFTQCSATWDKETEKAFYIARAVLLYSIPLVLMTIAYTQIVRVLWKSDTIPGHRESRTHQYNCGYLRPRGQAANSSTMNQLRARRKAAKMLVAVVIMFAGCFFPVHCLNILRYTIEIKQSDLIAVLALFSHWLCYANSAINPVIYNFMSGKFRREFQNALDKCRCGRVRVEDRFGNNSTPANRFHNISPSTRSNYQLTSVRDMSHLQLRRNQTLQTSFIENGGGNGQMTPMLIEERTVETKLDGMP